MLCNNISARIIKLKNVSVKSSIKGLFALVEIIQFYDSPGDENEMIFKFPIDSNSAINKFLLKYGNEIIEAKIFENNEAYKKFAKAKKKNKTVALCTEVQNDKDSFDIGLGNIPCDEPVTIELSYVVPLHITNNECTFIFPKIVTTKYGVSNKNKITYNHKMSIQCDIEMNSKISSITSYGYNITKKINKRKALVSLESTVEDVSAFYLTIKLEQLEKSRSYIELYKDTFAIASFIPPKLVRYEFDKIKKTDLNIIFMIDKSDSMGKKYRMENAKKALILMLKSLPKKSLFNIITFSYTPTYFKEWQVEYNKNTLNEALDFINKIEASGGTEIHDALKYVYSNSKKIK